MKKTFGSELLTILLSKIYFIIMIFMMMMKVVLYGRAP